MPVALPFFLKSVEYWIAFTAVAVGPYLKQNVSLCILKCSSSPPDAVSSVIFNQYVAIAIQFRLKYK
jgi:hypothetical protein